MLCLLAAVLSSASAFAQDDGAWMLIPIVHQSEAQSPVPVIAQALIQEMIANGHPAMELGSLASLFENRASHPTPTVDTKAIKQIETSGNEALNELAGASYKRATAILEPCLKNATDKPSAISADPMGAFHLYNACLYLARVFVETNQTNKAEVQIRRCRALVPNIKVDTIQHPPDVVTQVRAVDSALAKSSHALSIRSTPDNCLVLINGRKMGTSPLTLGGLPQGSYWVQAVCDTNAQGREHRIELGARDVEYLIDTQFDGALRSDEHGLFLSYADPKSASNTIPSTSHSLKCSGASRVIIAPCAPSPIKPGALRIRFQAQDPLIRRNLQAGCCLEPAWQDLLLAGYCTACLPPNPRVMAATNTAPVETMASCVAT
ncbi:MAG: PEGA domain-containing protein [Myxococcales bacterium]|nr:MAG: PEGA domain-containing protein [Myxococcales bacterium]